MATYKEKFLRFCKALEVRNPEEFIEEDSDNVYALGRFMTEKCKDFSRKDKNIISEIAEELENQK